MKCPNCGSEVELSPVYNTATQEAVGEQQVCHTCYYWKAFNETAEDALARRRGESAPTTRAVQETARAKLRKLGLTEEEVNTLFGTIRASTTHGPPTGNGGTATAAAAH